MSVNSFASMKVHNFGFDPHGIPKHCSQKKLNQDDYFYLNNSMIVVKWNSAIRKFPLK